jgi:hypothetical protein
MLGPTRRRCASPGSCSRRPKRLAVDKPLLHAARHHSLKQIAQKVALAEAPPIGRSATAFEQPEANLDLRLRERRLLGRLPPQTTGRGVFDGSEEGPSYVPTPLVKPRLKSGLVS